MEATGAVLAEWQSPEPTSHWGRDDAAVLPMLVLLWQQ